MQKFLFVCDRCKAKSTRDGFLTSIHIYNYKERIEDSYDLCYECFKDLVRFVKSKCEVIEPDNKEDEE